MEYTFAGSIETVLMIAPNDDPLNTEISKTVDMHLFESVVFAFDSLYQENFAINATIEHKLHINDSFEETKPSDFYPPFNGLVTGGVDNKLNFLKWYSYVGDKRYIRISVTFSFSWYQVILILGNPESRPTFEDNDQPQPQAFVIDEGD